jgi:branched-chain amino acid transport system ATP-binding protein
MVGIGRGLMGGGRLLMLDEPSLGLAPIVIDQIYEVIAELAAAGQSILVVEENAARVADKAALITLLDNGRLVWTGQGAELMARPEILETYLGA